MTDSLMILGSVWNVVWTVLCFLFAIAILIAVHEYGHFITARLCGVKVLRFSLGFGKVLCSFKDRRGTEWSLSLIPLGGYVQMLDSTEGEVKEEELEHEFNFQPVWKRFLIVFMGPFFNIVLALAVYWLMFMIGVPGLRPAVTDIAPGSPAAAAGIENRDLFLRVDGEEVRTWQDTIFRLVEHIGESGVPVTVQKDLGAGAERTVSLNLSGWVLDRQNLKPLSSIGITPYVGDVTDKVAFVAQGSGAELAGIRTGDRLLSLNGKPYKDWNSFTSEVRSMAPGSYADAGIERDGKKMDLKVLIRDRQDEGKTVGYFGVAPAIDRNDSLLINAKYGPLESVGMSFYKTGEVLKFTWVTLGKLISGSIPVNNISGPIAVARGAGETANMGIVYFLSFLGIISVNLGIVNLIPLPVLDGGHLLFYAIEAVFRRPVPEKVQRYLMSFGVAVLVLLTVFTVFNDIVYWN